MISRRGVFMCSLIFVLGLSCFAEESSQPVASSQSKISYSKEQEYLFDIFSARRSVRQFKSIPIPQEHILKIMDIARLAPTSGNQQPWKFLVVQDRTKLSQLQAASISFILQKYLERKTLDAKETAKIKGDLTRNLEGYLAAPVFVVILTDSNSKYPDYNVKDGSLAAGYMMIAARALGYGSVFCTDSFPFDVIRDVFKIPARYEIICSIPIGIPESWPPKPPKKSLDEMVVFEKF
jgi:nitroreductase